MSVEHTFTPKVAKLFKFLDQAKIPQSSEVLDESVMAEITRLWEDSHPADNFWMLDAISVTPTFRKQYMTELQTGYENQGAGVDAFVAETIQKQGKIPFEKLVATDSPWHQSIQRSKLVQYRDLL